jgi:hypothetical protein
MMNVSLMTSAKQTITEGERQEGNRIVCSEIEHQPQKEIERAGESMIQNTRDTLLSIEVSLTLHAVVNRRTNEGTVQRRQRRQVEEKS